MEQINPSQQVRPSLVFFLIHAMQIGVGIFGFQSVLAKTVGYDSWISILIALAFSHFILFIIFKIIEMGKGDLFDIHRYIFGKILGTFFTLLFSVYILAAVVLTIRRYIEVVQVWVFKEMSTLALAVALLALAFYAVMGGLRTIAGVSFISVLLPAYLLAIFTFAIPYSDFSDFFPIFSHSFKNIFIATCSLSISFLGYEQLLVYSPYVQDIKQAKKWGHLGLFSVGMIYLYLTVLSFAYYSEKQLEIVIWPTLSMWKIVKLSFIWRFEYIGISMWSLVILPNICLYLWALSRMVEKTFFVKRIYATSIVSFIILLFTIQINTKEQIESLVRIINVIGFSFVSVYIPLIFLLLFIVKKVREPNEL